MVKLRCCNCNYVFERNITNRVPAKCPYCDTTGTLFQEKSVLDLVDEGPDEEDLA